MKIVIKFFMKKELYNFFLLISILFFFFLPILFFGQRNIQKSTDSLLIVENERLRNVLSRKELIVWNNNIAKKCLKNNYPKGEALAYINIGNLLWGNFQFEESLKNLKKAEDLINQNNIEDDYVKGKLNIEYAQLYNYLDLPDLAIKYCNQSINYFSNLSGIKNRRALTYAYGCNSTYYYKVKKNDLALKSLKNAIKLIPNPLDVSNVAYHYTIIQYNKDSANLYFKKAFELTNSSYFKFDYYQKAVVFIHYSNFLIKEKKYDDALVNLLKTKVFIEKSENKYLKLDLFNSYYDLYRKLGNKNKETEYFTKYYILKDSLEKENLKGVKVTFEELYKNNDENKNIILKKNYLLIFFLVIFFLVVIFGYLVYVRRKRRNFIKLNKIQKEYKVENDNLKKKVNESFNEIIAMAKSNHPNFYTRFQEIYPDFQKKILSINPNLQNSELVLLAYIYLNFETKEIADYTFKSVKTIHNRRHLLRKKLNISSLEDLCIWLKSNSI